MKRIIVVGFLENTGAIGYKNSLIIKSKKDMEHFKNLTTKTIDNNKINMIIMGKNTYLSIPHKFRPLNNRLNIVISSTLQEQLSNLIIYKSIDDYLDNEMKLIDIYNIENVYIIGGESIYKQFLEKQLIDICICSHFITNNIYNYDSIFPIDILNNEFKPIENLMIIDEDKSNDLIIKIKKWIK